MNDEWFAKLSSLLSDAVNLEHQAFYFYLAAAVHFDSPAVSLTNLRDFFYSESDDELKHAKIVITHMNQRGLNIMLNEIVTVDTKNMSLQYIFEQSENFEKKVLDHYLLIQKEADKVGDYSTTQFIDHFIEKQIKEVKEFHDRAMNAKRCESSLGEFLFDQSFSNSKK